MELTSQQKECIEAQGKLIVSASAGSGKTFVMIERLANALESGVDADNVLAVTFTKKAAAQMKEKLKKALIERMKTANAEKQKMLKSQLAKISSASISTIHAFCAHLLRTYFYAAGIDGSFDIIPPDDPLAEEYKAEALESLFDRLYEEEDGDFMLLLSCFRKKRSDKNLKELILSSYDKLRKEARYEEIIKRCENLYTEQGFERVVTELEKVAKRKYEELEREVLKFSENFYGGDAYKKIFGEMLAALRGMQSVGIFGSQLPLTVTRKPTDKTDEEKAAGEEFKKFRDEVSKRYKAIKGDIEEREFELSRFLKSGEVASAFLRVIFKFDEEYAAVKLDENKLDCDDLEHLTVKLLENEEILKEIKSKYTCVFVDEYQDVNPVQDEIISKISGDSLFLVGDVKQAIYGFRGSKSSFFSEKFRSFEKGEGKALKLSHNFRSSDGVLSFANSVFSDIMQEENCGFSYKNDGVMVEGGAYPKGYGISEIHIFGKEEKIKKEAEIYSVEEDSVKAVHSREGLAVLEIVKRELGGKHFNVQTGEYEDTQPGDICILTRKNNKVKEIVRTLSDAGYSVSGAQEGDITSLPEVWEMRDILSYLDNSCQDIPLATSLLSPLGNLTHDELAKIRMAEREGRTPFRECCEKYALRMRNKISEKLKAFYKKIAALRELSEIFDAAELIDKIMEDTGFEATYFADGGQKIRNIRRLAAAGAGKSLSAFVTELNEKIKITGGFATSSESIKLMTMHASKGLEFPIVIIADIAASFSGRDKTELYFSPEFGFAPKCFDRENMLVKTTILRRLLKEIQHGEELKNEMNLFYVACTRAMCNLHIMAEEKSEFSPIAAKDAPNYAQMFDMEKFRTEEMPTFPDIEKEKGTRAFLPPNEELKERIENHFMRGYAFANSINLPVKSSASALLKLAEDEYFSARELFPAEREDERETGAERGTAYHRFLELCDFNIKDEKGILREVESLAKSGGLTKEQVGLLDVHSLYEILNMEVFKHIGEEQFREQEFLCRLPANSIFETTAEDGILVQGAIDLLCKDGEGFTIVDYKYSKKNDEKLRASYFKQLKLYKKVVAKITRTPEERIKTVIVNIFARRQINL